jgi:hypothetical protein
VTLKVFQGSKKASADALRHTHKVLWVKNNKKRTSIDNMGKIWQILDMKRKVSKISLLPPDLGKIETVAVLRKEAKARQALAELKGFAPIIPNQNILINAISLQEAQESSAIENIITTDDELYKNLTIKSSSINSDRKSVV